MSRDPPSLHPRVWPHIFLDETRKHSNYLRLMGPISVWQATKEQDSIKKCQGNLTNPHTYQQKHLWKTLTANQSTSQPTNQGHAWPFCIRLQDLRLGSDAQWWAKPTPNCAIYTSIETIYIYIYLIPAKVKTTSHMKNRNDQPSTVFFSRVSKIMNHES